MMPRICLYLVLAVMAAFRPMSATAQASHVERLQDAARACLGHIPDELESFRLSTDARAPYIRSALVSDWLAEGKTVYDDAIVRDADEGASDMARFSYETDAIEISFDPVGGGVILRHATVGMSYGLTGADAQVLIDSRCDQTLSDSLDASLAKALRDHRWPETDVAPENRSILGKIVKPVVVLGAAAVGTWLFFNLRSERAEDG